MSSARSPQKIANDVLVYLGSSEVPPFAKDANFGPIMLCWWHAYKGVGRPALTVHNGEAMCWECIERAWDD